MNSYFATIEQQANPRWRGKPIGITGGDRSTRTVLSTASVEAKKLGAKTGMTLWEAKKVCPQIIIVPGDSDKYLHCTTRFLNILKDYTPYLEVFSIDEAFIQIESGGQSLESRVLDLIMLAQQIKQRIKDEIGEWVTCSVGVSYNKLMAKLASELQKPDGLVLISNQEEAIKVLDTVKLDDICGIGPRIKKRLFNLGIINFKKLRQVSKECLSASFKSYGEVLYNMARGIDHTPIKPFYEREEVKSVGHRHTIDHDTADSREIKQILLKLCEMVAFRLRQKELEAKTIHLWYRCSDHLEGVFLSNGTQKTLFEHSSEGLEIFNLAWEIFYQLWNGEKIRMIGVSVSNLRLNKPVNISWLPEEQKKKVIVKALDQINNKYGNFTLTRGSLLSSYPINRKPNSFLTDRRFKI